MAQINFNIPDNIIARVIDSYATVFNYDTQKLDNETKSQFTKRMIIRQMKDVTKQYEGEIAAKNVEQNARQKVESEIIIT